MNVQSIHTRLFEEGESLERFIREHIPKLTDGCIVAVTSKITALAERRTAPAAEKEKWIVAESERAMPTKHAWLTVKDGMILPAAGIDDSNANGKIILLPKNSFRTAARLRRALCKHYKLKRLGVIITDSRVPPLRAGVVGIALGYAGFSGIADYRGSRDLFGRILKMTRVDIADSLATAAVLLMGEGAERKPLAVIKGAPVMFRDRINQSELTIPIQDDLYAPLFGDFIARTNRRRKRRR